MTFRLLDGANDALPRPFRGPMRFGLLPASGGTPPAPDPFPAIAGEFVHYRQEDVGPGGVTAAHGLPLHMDLVGTLNRVKVGNADYMDCTAGALDVVKDVPWPPQTGFTLWAIVEGRSPDDCFYNGPPLYVASDATMNFTAHGEAKVSSVPKTFPLPAAAGGETLAYIRPPGNHRLGGILCRHNGVYIDGTVGSNPWTRSDGAAFTIGGRRDPSGGVLFGGLRWRDVVLYVGTPEKPDVSDAERAALEAYAVTRIAGTA